MKQGCSRLCHVTEPPPFFAQPVPDFPDFEGKQPQAAAANHAIYGVGDREGIT